MQGDSDFGPGVGWVSKSFVNVLSSFRETHTAGALTASDSGEQ
jgi:hypothetical protein